MRIGLMTAGSWFVLAVSFTFAGGGASTQPVLKSSSGESRTTASLTEALRSNDTKSQDDALKFINQVLSEPQKKRTGRENEYRSKVDPMWVKALMDQERPADADALAIKGILASPEDTGRVCFLQHLRVEGFIKEGKADEALHAAKSYYNVCGLKQSADAVELLSEALADARKDDKGIVRRFRQQQVDLSKADATRKPGDPPVVNILDSVTPETAVFEKSVPTVKGHDAYDLIGEGNILLLCGKATEAKDAFEQAQDFAVGKNDASAALEGAARAIRAATNAIGPANAYIVAQQGH